MICQCIIFLAIYSDFLRDREQWEFENRKFERVMNKSIFMCIFSATSVHTEKDEFSCNLHVFSSPTSID